MGGLVGRGTKQLQQPRRERQLLQQLPRGEGEGRLRLEQTKEGVEELGPLRGRGREGGETGREG